MKNWKTTLTGLIGAIAVALIPAIQGNGFDPETLVTAATLAALGFIAKDYDTTGIGVYAEKAKDVPGN